MLYDGTPTQRRPDSRQSRGNRAERDLLVAGEGASSNGQKSSDLQDGEVLENRFTRTEIYSALLTGQRLRRLTLYRSLFLTAVLKKERQSTA